MEFDRAVQVLIDGEVEFVVIGGVSAILHGSSMVTFDVDICYFRAALNLRRPVAALAPFHPKPRGFPAGLPFTWDQAKRAFTDAERRNLLKCNRDLRSRVLRSLCTNGQPINGFSEHDRCPPCRVGKPAGRVDTRRRAEGTGDWHCISGRRTCRTLRPIPYRKATPARCPSRRPAALGSGE